MIGLSGGVDSAVAAYLLKQQGYEVIGGFMRNWDALANNDVLGNPTLGRDMCPQEVDYADAQAVAKKLDIPLNRIDFIKEYWDEVFSFFIQEYKKGRTPNPDIFCNKYIKFASFRQYALLQGCQTIAMGHYAKRDFFDNQFRLLRSFDKDKDQTYFLSQISQEQLSHSLFPLADISKTQVRSIARKLELPVAEKKDSTGVCFIGERNFKEFLKNYIPAQPGNIVDMVSNEVIGHHDGVFYYTIGQRRGLGIGGLLNHASSSWFIVKKDVVSNILYVASEFEDRYLLADKAIISHINWISGAPKKGTSLTCKFRYRQADVEVKIKNLSDSLLEVSLAVPFKAITPGQSAVFYSEIQCLGGGIIEEVFFEGKKIS
jgi:tRNA-specific 2-thiouridylase